MKRITQLSLSLVAMLTLSACATTDTNVFEPTSQSSANFGDAMRHNIAAQRIAPTPEQKANTYIPANRARQALARERYETDEVEELEKLSTTR